MEQLRERIERESYAVDPHKVADAIVRRLLAEVPPTLIVRSRASARLTDPPATARRAHRPWRGRSSVTAPAASAAARAASGAQNRSS